VDLQRRFEKIGGFGGLKIDLFRIDKKIARSIMRQVITGPRFFNAD
jgi:hypothetical protein